MTTNDFTTTNAPENPLIQKRPGETLESDGTASDTEAVSGLLIKIYDELSQLLAISEYTQGAVEKLMPPEDTDYSQSLVIGVGQVHDWMQSRGKCVKALLKQAIDLSRASSPRSIDKGGQA